jgi:DNA mismatch repair protein MutS
MGGRILRQCLANPLLDIGQIEERQEAVEACMQFLQNESFNSEQALLELGLIRDIERLIVRIQTGNAGPRDVSYLAECLRHVAPLQRLLQPITHPPLAEQIASLATLEDLVKLISSSLTDEPPLRVSDGNVIRHGVNSELDTLRTIQQNSHQWLLEYQTRLRESLGIKTLKVGFTRAFGYYIEVSRGQTSLMPASFARRQTLTNAERYISEELRTFEEAVLTAEKKIEGLENALFEELKTSVLVYTQDILETSARIAKIDFYLSLAQVALDGNYVRPKVVLEPNMQIIDGRHPVLDQKNPLFVPNDLDMKASGPSLMLITGPNMAGKSTFIRQAALLVIMAQVGSFVPAKKALIGIVDRVFSRIGASDDLSTGQSTFMVEMSETASILHQATPRSLILLDEIGRGTSTYDGISIAWSVCEYLLRFDAENARTLFATHYYELTQLEQRFSSVRNMTVAISEQPSGIKFLYKVVPGKTDRSYGIHVAKLAGLPQRVVERAEKVLAELEEKRPHNNEIFIQQELFTITTKKPEQSKKEEAASYDFLKDLDLSKISPLDCFMKLVRFKNSIK